MGRRLGVGFLLSASIVGQALLWPSAEAPDPAAVAASQELVEAAPRDVLVRFEAGAGASEREAARRKAGAELEESLPLAGLQLVDPDPGLSAAQVAERLERSDDVLYAEPDFPRTIAVTPNDPRLGSLWGLHNSGQTVAGRRGTSDADIDAPEAWNLTTGSAGIGVGVVDSGVDYGHPDLSPNIWLNVGESGGGRESNGVDDDRNGLVDDWRGWDWVDGDNAPMDDHGHGTHVAGTIGARGNDGVGVVGVAWQVGVLPLRVLDSTGSGSVSDVISAYAYARRRQLRVVNASLGGSSFSQAEHDAIEAAPSNLFVVAAGNEGANNDATPAFPCNYDLANVLCVAATDQHDVLAGFSNYGATSVDLAAPGATIASTWLGGGWAFMDGTSMATPHVAGAAALVWARSPSATVASVRLALLAGVDLKTSLLTKTVTGGRLNAYRSVAIGAGANPSIQAPDVPELPDLSPPSSGSTTIVEPAPSQSMPSAPGSTSDTTPPRVSVRTRSVLDLRTALRRGVRTSTHCSEACTLRHELVLGAARARRLRLSAGSRPMTVGRARGGVGSAGSVVLRVRFGERARRRFGRLGSLRLRLRTTALDAAGNRTRLSRAVRLRR